MSQHRRHDHSRPAASETSKSRNHGKPWVRRHKHQKTSNETPNVPDGADVWQPAPKAGQPFAKAMCPPFGIMPPIMPKQGVGMPRGAPVMFPFMDPAMYQNMMKSMAAKAAGKTGEELDMKALMATLPPAAKMPFPLPKNMPVMGMPPPGMIFPGPFMGMPKKAPFPGVMPFVPDPAFSPKAAGPSPVRAQQTEPTSGHTQADNGRHHHSASSKYLSLSQVSRGGRSKRSRVHLDEGSENISVISDEDYRNSHDGARDALRGATTAGNSSPNIAFVNSFVPSPPERYRRDYQLHEVKMFSALGIRAQAKAKKLSPEVRASFESGPVKNGKLVLLLDLDNTLLHACSQSKLGMLDIQLSHFVDELGEPELYKFTMPNFANVRYYMKLRPALRGFLQVLSLYYEMSIYTNATKEYADVVVAILDPDRSLFMDRIVARTSVGERDLQKTAARLYPDLDTRFVVAFDDRTDVWADVPYNQVVKAEHYDFFDSHIAELSDSYGIVSPNSEGSYYSDSDRHLEYMVKVFLELHRRFFNDPFEASVGDILEDMQRSVLEGVGIMLTGYRKNSKGQGQVLQADCEQKQREIATQLGAKICTRLSDRKLTHVVAGKNCTDNIVKSKEPCYSHVHKVHTLWLYSCRATWTNVPPEKFNVDDICEAYSNEPPSQPCKDHWKILLSDDDDSDKRATSDNATEDQLPTRIFMGTGSYSHGTELISPTERVVIRWDSAKTKLLQNNTTDPIEQKSVKQIILENAPYTNSVNPERYV